VTADQIVLERLQIIVGDADVGEFAESSVDSVGGFAAGNDGFDHCTRCFDLRPCGIGDGDFAAAEGYCCDFFDGERLSGKR
jgi:hypothetical protein